MDSIRFEIYNRFVDFAGNFDIHDELKFNGIFKSDDYTDEFERELFSLIMMQKGDGVSMDISSSKNFHEIKIYLIYPEDTMDDTNLINVIQQWCNDKFVATNEEFDIQGVNIKEDGLIVELSDVYYPKLKESLIAEFEKNNIVCEVISHEKRAYEQGAGDYREQIYLFIASAIGSGMSWDIAKSLILRVYHRFTDETESIAKHKAFNGEKLLEFVSEMSGEIKTNLNITSFTIDPETNFSNIVIQSRNRKFYLTCDQKQSVIDFRVENKIQTGI
ncbi:hypothetical protein AB1I68_00305 [Paenibacillus pabuli]|uniref:hypothetical protein n=1 Tax=Paenibacillus pabuli TaxID=1472 RepID=UPI003458D6E2